MQDNDARDRELLGALQGDIPLVSTPFAVVGQQIDMSEKEVIKRAEKLKRDGVIRQISGHFDLRALGYRSCLVAARVKPERIDDAANVVNAHPGVTQNYKRNNDFNLWFTIAVSPASKLGLERTIEVIGEEAECEAIRPLPTLKLYKTTEGGESHVNETEAHEAWEELWLVAATDVEQFLQGLIQVAAAYHHVQRGTLRGAVRLFDAGLARLARFPDEFCGVDRKPVETAARVHRTWAAERLERGEEDRRLDPLDFPRLILVDESAIPAHSDW